MRKKIIGFSIAIAAALALSSCTKPKKKDEASTGTTNAATPEPVVPPGAPILSIPRISFPDSSNIISNQTSLSISGTCETGSTVNLGGSTNAASNCTTGTFAFVVDQFSDGIFSFGITQTDLAGNTSAAANLSWTRDTTISAPTVSSPNASPYIASANTLVISGSCESGATVSIGGGVSASEILNPSGSLTQTCVASNYMFEVSKSTDGAYSFSLGQVDSAGNTSSTVTQEWVLNSALPSSPTITSPIMSPFYSKNSSLLISGECLTGYTVELNGADNLTTICADSAFSFSVAKNVDDNYSFNIKQISPSNLTSASISQTWIRDTFVLPPTVTSPASSGVYYSAGASISINGDCEPGAAVNIDGALKEFKFCSNAGTYSFNFESNVDGTYDFAINQYDMAGNSSTSTSFSWTRNSMAPANPTITTPSANFISSNGDSLLIEGGCITGNVVTLTGDDDQEYTCLDNLYSFTSSKLVDGVFHFSVYQTDFLTEVQSGQSNLTWQRDTVAPAATTIASPTSNPLISGSNSITLSGTCEMGAHVQLGGADNQNQICTADGFSFMTSQTNDGTYNFSLSATDSANNVSTTTFFTWTRDSAVPSPPSITSPATNPTYSSGSSFILSGGCTPGLLVTLSGIASSEVLSPVGSLTQTCDSSTQTYSYTVAANLEGSYNVGVKQTSLAGAGSGIQQIIWIRDTLQPPVALGTTKPTSPNYKAESTFSFSSAEAGATFVCSFDGVNYSSCASPLTKVFTNAPADNGAKTFYVKAIDLAGNVSAAPATYSWTQSYYWTLGLYQFENAVLGTDSGNYLNTMTNSSTSPTVASGTGKFGDGAAVSSTGPKFFFQTNNATQFLGNSTMTVEAWIKPSSTGFASSTSAPAVFMSKSRSNPNTSNLGWLFGAIKGTATGKIKLVFWGSVDGTRWGSASKTNAYKIRAGTEVTVPVISGTSTPAWFHVAATFNKGAVTLYFNGTQVGTGIIGTAGTAALYNSTADLAVGIISNNGTADTTNNAYFLNASVDDVRLSQVVRTISVPTNAYIKD